MKACCRCSLPKELEAFNVRRASKDGRQPHCRECDREIHQGRKKNPVGGIAMWGGMTVNMTLDEVGRELGISRSRVQQLEQRALRKLRAALEVC